MPVLTVARVNPIRRSAAIASRPGTLVVPDASREMPGQTWDAGAPAWPLRTGVVIALIAGLAGSSGLDVRGRLLFALAATGAFAFTIGETHLRGIIRHPAVVALLTLGILELASLGWTVGDVSEGRWWATGALTAGMLVVASAAVARQHGGSAFLAGAIAVLAAVSAAGGLVAVAAERTPWAECLSGLWRPGGPLEYPPALALLQVSAAPVALCWMCGPGRLSAAGGAVVSGLAVATIALSGSRTQLVLAGLIVIWSVAMPGLLGASRRLMVAAVSAAVAAGLALAALAHSGLGGGEAAAFMALLLCATTLGWVWLRDRPRGGVPAAGVAIAGAFVLTAGMATATPVACATPPDGGFTHGRIALWQAAGQTAAERPLLGAGAAAFLPATAERQGDGAVRFAHSQPIELAVELGALGVAVWIGLAGGLVLALRRARRSQAFALLAPAAVAFPLANMVDWPWHLVGALAVWAVALGALIGEERRR